MSDNYLALKQNFYVEWILHCLTQKIFGKKIISNACSLEEPHG